jgi:hypothetical protein
MEMASRRMVDGLGRPVRSSRHSECRSRRDRAMMLRRLPATNVRRNGLVGAATKDRMSPYCGPRSPDFVRNDTCLLPIPQVCDKALAIWEHLGCVDALRCPCSSVILAGVQLNSLTGDDS